MSDDGRSIGTEELEAYLDGALDADARQEVERAIREDPRLAADLAELRRINEGLHALYDPVLAEPVPERLSAVVRGSGRTTRDLRRWTAMAASVALAFGLAVGFGAGWFVRGPDEANPGLFAATVKASVLQHRAMRASLRSGNRLPVTPREVISQAQSEIAIAAPLRVPETAGEQHFAPVAHRASKGQAGDAVQFLYEDPERDQVSLFVRSHTVGARGIPFDQTVEGEFQVLYWVDGPLLYILVGDDQDDLMDLATTVYASPGLSPGQLQMQPVGD